MDLLPGDMGLDFVRAMAEFRGEAIRDGLKNGHTNHTRKGQLAHGLLERFIGKQVDIPGAGRADGIIRLAGKAFDIMIELKPNNPRAIARGKSQLKKYLEHYDGNAVGLVITY